MSSEITTEQVEKYYKSLSEKERLRAFSALLWWTTEISDVRYDEERNIFYWESNGESIADE